MPNPLMKVEIGRGRNGKTTNTKGADVGLELLAAADDYLGVRHFKEWGISPVLYP